jgi:hypothetical protein
MNPFYIFVFFGCLAAMIANIFAISNWQKLAQVEAVLNEIKESLASSEKPDPD